jgi:hypothetical protein
MIWRVLHCPTIDCRVSTQVNVNQVNQNPSVLVKQQDWNSTLDVSVIVTGMLIDNDNDANNTVVNKMIIFHFHYRCLTL